MRTTRGSDRLPLSRWEKVPTREIICSIMLFLSSSAYGVDYSKKLNECPPDVAVSISSIVSSEETKDDLKLSEVLKIGASYLRNQSFVCAVDIYSVAVELGTLDPRPYAFRAEAHGQKGDPQAALADVTKAIKLEPTEPSLYLLRAGLYRHLGRPADELSDINAHIALAGSGRVEDRVYLERGRTLKTLGRYEEAIVAFTEAIDAQMSSMAMRRQSYMERAMTYELLDNFASAVDDYSSVISADRTNSYAYFRRGNAYLLQEGYAVAENDLTRAIELNPAFQDGYLFRGIVRSKLGDLDAALGDFNSALALGDNAHAFLRRGAIYGDLGGLRSALRDVDRAIELDPELPDAAAVRDAIVDQLTAR